MHCVTFRLLGHCILMIKNDHIITSLECLCVCVCARWICTETHTHSVKVLLIECCCAPAVRRLTHRVWVHTRKLRHADRSPAAESSAGDVTVASALRLRVCEPFNRSIVQPPQEISGSSFGHFDCFLFHRIWSSFMHNESDWQTSTSY